jgi:uncharacterized protein (TIGR01319 family)
LDSIRILVDFGSTYTKVVAIDIEKTEIMAQAFVTSTVKTDITIGLKEAMGIVKDCTKINNIERKQILACSSAAGGLRMICIGFVPDYTSKAGNFAALGAGAKVIDCFSFRLNNIEIKQIEKLSPDIILLCGGTDGGNYKTIIHNAKQLSKANEKIKNIIVAGNKATHDEIQEIFKGSGKRIYFTDNVMPELKKLNLEPCKNIIREIFIQNIIEAKGITKAKEIIQNVILPTPAAVMKAAKLIAEGYNTVSGLGELMLVDVGGATTDVYSIGQGLPTCGNINMKGIPEPYEKRTVEGDLGLKYNIDTLAGLIRCGEATIDSKKAIKVFQEGQLPSSGKQWNFHMALSKQAVETAVNRHVGRLDKLYFPEGEIIVQHGKDLTKTGCFIGAGGPLIFSPYPQRIMEGALFNSEVPNLLKPKSPIFFLDKSYILFAIGLISQSNPAEALSLAKKYLVRITR